MTNLEIAAELHSKHYGSLTLGERELCRKVIAGTILPDDQAADFAYLKGEFGYATEEPVECRETADDEGGGLL